MVFDPTLSAQVFIPFLTAHSREAVGSYAENQRITAVRRVYQRGCVNPMINIEQLWRDYSKYEEVREKWITVQNLRVCVLNLTL